MFNTKHLVESVVFMPEDWDEDEWDEEEDLDEF